SERGIDSKPVPRPTDYDRCVAEIIAVAAEAVHCAHDAGVVHLDIKPSNILIEATSMTDPTSLHPWVIDFGLSRATEVDGVAGAAETNANGNDTRGFGTKGFMAPEVLVCRAHAAEHDRSKPAARPSLARTTDVWSLGVTLYQVLTLQLPFRTDAEVLDPLVAP